MPYQQIYLFRTNAGPRHPTLLVGHFRIMPRISSLQSKENQSFLLAGLRCMHGIGHSYQRPRRNHSFGFAHRIMDIR